MYRVLLFVHILSAIVWFGGAMFSEALVAMNRRKGDREYVATWTSVAETGARVYPFATILLIVTAIAMVVQRWSFGTMWIDVALGLFILSFVVGIAYFSPRGKKINEAFEAGEAVPGLVARIRPVHMAQRVDLLVLTVILILMIYKPT
jgi:hypothetical protein